MDINSILGKLTLNTPKEEREAVVQEVLDHYEDYDLKEFILPVPGKSYWPGCATILTRLPENIFISMLPDVLEWMQDCTWPGAREIVMRVVQLPRDIIKAACKNVYKRALEEKDEEWIYNLKMIFGDDILD